VSVRDRLPDRRPGVTAHVVHPLAGGGQLKVLVTFGFDKETWTVREMFCASFKEGSDNQSLVVDACILLSKALQSGDTLESMKSSLCTPPSLIGSMIDAGLEIQTTQRRHHRDQRPEQPQGEKS
jgi:hypothetical protein